jgi:peptidoglycan/LPS O-acetylase OafA/YrhL
MIGYRPDIDGLRAVAVLPVVLFHARIAGFEGGFIGVDVFFVISGYLITGILLDDLRQESFSILRFYERRIRRIFPALFVIFFFCLVVAYEIFLPLDFEKFANSLLAATFFSSNVLFWFESGYFDAPSELKPLLHTWSLAVEEQFYIFFPIFLFVIWRFARSRLIPITATILVLSFLIGVWQVRVEPSGAFFLPPARIWELMLGALLAMGAVPRFGGATVHQAASVLGLGLIAWGVFAFSPQTSFPGESALFPCLGAGLLIYSGGCHQSLVYRILATKGMVFIGKISYSLYLWHWPLLVFANYYAVSELTALETASIIAVSLALSAASWRYVESPFRGRQPILRRPALFALAGSAMSAAAALAIVVAVGDGLPRRVPAEVVQLANGATDKDPGRQKCENRSPWQIRNRVMCLVGAQGSGEPSFVYWGDSQAEAYFAAFGEAAREAGRAGWYATRPGCPSLFGVSLIRPGFDEICIALSKEVEALIADSHSVDTVFLASAWSLYATGQRYAPEKGPDVLIQDERTVEPSLAENRRVFREGLERTVKRLHELGKKVVVVASAPEVGWYVPSVLALAKWFDRPLDIRPRLEDYLARQTSVFQQFREVQERYGVQVVYPHEPLCNSEYCEVSRDGKSLYYDFTHLNNAGNRVVKDIFGPVL